VVSLLILSVLAATTLPAGASTLVRHRPTVVFAEEVGWMYWGEELGWEWTFWVDVQDPDGVIWEIEVEWGDGTYAWATTFCVQGKRVGKTARMRIGHPYQEDGTYRVRIHASSYPRCPLGHRPMPMEHGPRASKTLVIEVPA
jgi:hypothetical protein